VRKSTKITVRWGRVITALILGLVLAGMAWWWLSITADSVDARLPVAQSESSDPWGGVPWCTDQIADAGGVCHGEPTAEPNGLAETPTPVPTASSVPVPVVVAVSAVDPAEPVEEVNEDPWLTGEDGTRYFEDGSWLAADGTQGCTDGMPCSQLPPVPAGTPTTPNGGYWPTLTLEACTTEDSDNCYWDAELRGDGIGQSFIVVNGVHYYKETNK